MPAPNSQNDVKLNNSDIEIRMQKLIDRSSEQSFATHLNMMLISKKKKKKDLVNILINDLVGDSCTDTTRDNYNKKIGRYLSGESIPTDYQVVIVICIALKLSFEQSEMLLSKAGFSIGKFSKKDGKFKRDEQIHYSALLDTEAFDSLGKWNDYFVENGASTLMFVKNSSNGCES